jgi:flagellar hook assembly protein FlgD
LTVPNREGAQITYFLHDKPAGKVTITVANAAGQAVRTLDGPANAGLNRVEWNARGGRTAVTPGEYTITLQVGEKKLSRPVTIRPRPDYLRSQTMTAGTSSNPK